MPFPSNDQSRNLGLSGGKSNKNDYAPSLDSIDSKYHRQPTGNASNDGSTWDTETGQFLSPLSLLFSDAFVLQDNFLLLKFQITSYLIS